MSRAKWGWLSALALFYALFWTWYGGQGSPLSALEGRQLLDAIGAVYRAGGVEPAKTDFRANIEAMIAADDGREFYMVNLETRQPGPAAIAAEASYSAVVLPLLLERASHPVYVGERAGLALGQLGQSVDRVAIVRYRSLRDLLEMNADPAMLRGTAYKFAALAHTEVFITRPIIAAETVRLLLALLLLVAGWAGCRALDRLAAARTAT